MNRRPSARLSAGIMSLCLLASHHAAAVNARPASDAAATTPAAAAATTTTPGPDTRRAVSRAAPQDEGAFDSLEAALRSPEKARRLVIGGSEIKRLPPGLGRLVNLESLEMSCLESLEELPEEIGSLSKLESLVIDNGNGCSMNVTLPRSIGRLSNLRVLRLYGALDPRDLEEGPKRPARSRALPETFADLKNLEELDLGRNGLSAVPSQVAGLSRLKKLSLDYNDIREVPAFVGELKNLEELSVNANGGTRLPQTLSGLKGLKVFMGNGRLTLAAQKALRARFPAAVFSFENEYDDEAANQEAPKPKAKSKRRR